jgi:Rrf2 family protein
MKTSCRFAMAVHVLAVLGYKGGDRVTSALLAGSVNTNPVIIRRLMLALKRARLIETGRGPGSGSRLSRSPARINLAEIYRAVERAEPFASPSRQPNDDCPVGKCIRTTLAAVFDSACTAMEKDLQRTTLAHVIDAANHAASSAAARPLGRARVHPSRSPIQMV